MSPVRVERLRLLIALAVAWPFVMAAVLSRWAPALVFEWFLVLVVGPPLYVVGEWFFGWLYSPEHGRRISSRSFSLLRVLLALGVILVLIALGVFASRALKYVEESAR